MRRSRIIMTTSCKGGVGKSTVAANVALCLARAGKRTLLVDMDLAMPCLDIILGVESKTIFSIADVIKGKASVKDAAITDERSDKLFFIGGPHNECKITGEQFEEFISKASDELHPDYILVDTPGDQGDSFVAASAVCGGAIIVATHAPTSLRAAEKTAMELARKNIGCRLVINEFDLSDLSSHLSGERATVVEMIDQSHVRLIGIVPFSYELERSSEDGALCDEVGGDPLAAFTNIARRICGENVVLFNGFTNRRKIRHSI